MNNKIALIIEDDFGLFSFLEKALENAGAISIHAETLKKSNKLIKIIYPDIIFVDNELPDGLGFKYIKTLRSVFPEVLIIAMTADLTTKDIILAKNNGANQVMQKPIQYDQLLSIVEEASKQFAR